MVEVRQRTLWIAGRNWTRRTRRRRGGGDKEEMRRRGEEQATDIKSNNPHLAGREQTYCKLYYFESALRVRGRHEGVRGRHKLGKGGY